MGKSDRKTTLTSRILKGFPKRKKPKRNEKEKGGGKKTSMRRKSQR
jgi:hypothetical protein